MARLRSDHPWNPGYALPKNVLDEPYGQGVIITKQVKRGTISALQPSWLVDGPGAQGSLGGVEHGSLGGSTIAGNSLRGGAQGSLSGTPFDAKEGPVQIGGASDPIANFGREAAKLVLSEMKKVLPAERVSTMRRVLDDIDAKLFDQVAAGAKARQAAGASAADALEKALAASLAGSYLEQLQKLGKTGQVPTSGVLGLALGTVSPDGLGSFWGSLKNAGAKIGGGLKKLACKAANNPAASIAATAAGGPAGGTGVQLASEMCGGSKAADVAPPPPPPAAAFPIVPVLIGGGVLLAVLALRK